MFKNIVKLAGCLFVLALSMYAHAQAPLFLIQRDGVTQFGANFMQHSPTSPVYNFCETAAACGGTTPPPIDPGAYSTLLVTWMGVGQGNTNARIFEGMWGKCSPGGIGGGWAGCNGATLKWNDNTTKYARIRLRHPDNPGTLSHFLKLDSYSTTQGLVVKFAVVAPDALWPLPTTPAGPCYNPHAIPQAVAVNLNPGPANTSKCPFLADVDILIDTSDPAARGFIGVSIN